MNKENFMVQLRYKKEMNATEAIKKLPAKDYFETEAGMEILRFISENVKIVNEKTFKMVDTGVTQRINNHPLYKGRDFFSDMKELGFEIQVVDLKFDVVIVETLLFKG